MIGNPGETYKSIMDNINFCKKISPEAAFFSISTPTPGTPLYKYCEDNNLLLTTDYDMYTFENQIIKLDNIPDYYIEKLLQIAKISINNGYTNKYGLMDLLMN
jgi:radical SAM superfamily enzyme YgiQ (UPF0313 family)